MNTAPSQTFITMINELPVDIQESLIEKIRPIVADMIDEYKWNRSYQKTSDKLEAFAKTVRQSNATSF